MAQQLLGFVSSSAIQQQSEQGLTGTDMQGVLLQASRKLLSAELTRPLQLRNTTAKRRFGALLHVISRICLSIPDGLSAGAG